MFRKYSYYLPTLGQSWLLALLFIGGQIFAGILLIPLDLLFPESDFISKCLAYTLTFLPVLFYTYKKGGEIFNEAKRLGVPSNDLRVKINAPNFGRINPIIFFILLFIVTFAYIIAIDPISSLMPVPEWFTKIMEQIFEGNIIYTFITLALLAPLLEEWLCRGIILRGLFKHITPTKAIMWSALIFAVMHMNPWQGIPCFILGCFYGWIYYKTRSIWAVIFLHFINNGSAALLYYYFPEIANADSLSDLLPDKATYWMLVSISIGVISLVIFIIDKYTKPSENE